MSPEINGLIDADAIITRLISSLYEGKSPYRYLPNDLATKTAHSKLCSIRRHLERMLSSYLDYPSLS